MIAVPEIEARGLQDRVSGRTKIIQYVLPGLALATAIALNAASAGRP